MRYGYSHGLFNKFANRSSWVPIVTATFLRNFCFVPLFLPLSSRRFIYMLIRLAVSLQLLRPASRACPRARDARSRLAIDVAAKILGCRRTVEGLDVDVLEAEAGARVRGAAVDGGGDVVAAGAGHVDPADVLDGQAGLVAALVRVDAAGDVDRLVDVLGLDVGEGDVLDQTRARVCLDPGRVGRVRAGDVVEGHVLDEVRLIGGVS